jgi:hypothetical protein
MGRAEDQIPEDAPTSDAMRFTNDLAGPLAPADPNVLGMIHSRPQRSA